MGVLLDASVVLIGISTMAFLFTRFVIADDRKKGLSFRQYAVNWLDHTDPFFHEIYVALVTSMIMAAVISLVSFRQIWSNDVFHVVFVASLLKPHISKLVQVIL